MRKLYILFASVLLLSAVCAAADADEYIAGDAFQYDEYEYNEYAEIFEESDADVPCGDAYWSDSAPEAYIPDDGQGTGEWADFEEQEEYGSTFSEETEGPEDFIENTGAEGIGAETGPDSEACPVYPDAESGVLVQAAPDTESVADSVCEPVSGQDAAYSPDSFAETPEAAPEYPESGAEYPELTGGASDSCAESIGLPDKLVIVPFGQDYIDGDGCAHYTVQPGSECTMCVNVSSRSAFTSAWYDAYSGECLSLNSLSCTARTDESGVYVFTAYNEAGFSRTQTVYVDVDNRLEIVNDGEAVEACRETEVTVKASVSASDTAGLTYTWCDPEYRISHGESCTFPAEESGEADLTVQDRYGNYAHAVYEVRVYDHQWSPWSVKKEANAIATGKKTRSCTRCRGTESAVIPKLKAFAAPQKSTVSMKENASATVGVSVGKGDSLIFVESSSVKTAKAKISGGKVLLKSGNTDGSASVKVITKGGASAVIKVKVTVTPYVKTSKKSAAMYAGNSVTISTVTKKGDRIVSAVPSNKKAMQAAVKGSKVVIKGLAPGSGKVTVKTQKGASVKIPVKVMKKPFLRFSKKSLKLGTGKTVFLTASMKAGDRLASAVSPDRTVLKVSLSGRRVKIKGLRKGKAKVTVKTKAGASFVLNVTVAG